MGERLSDLALMLPLLAVIGFQLATECYRLYLISHRRMFSWSMSFDGDTLRILRPDENPLVIRKLDCARLYPITGTLILRDGRAVHLCTPEERFVHCKPRSQWLEQWWPGLLRIAHETNSGTRLIQLQLWFGSALVCMFLALSGLYATNEIGWPPICFAALVGVVFASASLLHKSVCSTDWYQQPIDLDRLAPDMGHDTAVRSSNPNA